MPFNYKNYGVGEVIQEFPVGTFSRLTENSAWVDAQRSHGRNDPPGSLRRQAVMNTTGGTLTGGVSITGILDTLPALTTVTPLGAIDEPMLTIGAAGAGPVPAVTLGPIESNMAGEVVAPPCAVVVVNIANLAHTAVDATFVSATSGPWTIITKATVATGSQWCLLAYTGEGAPGPAGPSGSEHPHAIFECASRADADASVISVFGSADYIGVAPPSPEPLALNNDEGFQADGTDRILGVPFTDILDWQASHLYAANDEVTAVPNGGPTAEHKFRRNSSGTSGASFDTIEEIEWTDLGEYEKSTWKAVAVFSHAPQLAMASLSTQLYGGSSVASISGFRAAVGFSPFPVPTSVVSSNQTGDSGADCMVANLGGTWYLIWVFKGGSGGSDDKTIKVSTDDTAPGFLSAKYAGTVSSGVPTPGWTPVEFVSMYVTNGGGAEEWGLHVADPGRVRFDGSDNTLDYLPDKLAGADQSSTAAGLSECGWHYNAYELAFTYDHLIRLDAADVTPKYLLDKINLTPAGSVPSDHYPIVGVRSGDDLTFYAQDTQTPHSTVRVLADVSLTFEPSDGVLKLQKTFIDLDVADGVAVAQPPVVETEIWRDVITTYGADTVKYRLSTRSSADGPDHTDTTTETCGSGS